MANTKPRRHVTDRDLDILLALDRCPLTIRQLFELSETFLPSAAALIATPSTVRSRRLSPPSLLSCEELATLWHPPTATVRTPAMQVTESREREPPLGLLTPQTDPDIAVLGRVKFRSSRERFGIRPDDRRRHLAIIGKTGMGKTTLLHHLMASDVRSGHGLALLELPATRAADPPADAGRRPVPPQRRRPPDRPGGPLLLAARVRRLEAAVPGRGDCADPP